MPVGATESRASLLATWLALRAVGWMSTRLGGALAWRLWFTPWRTGATAASRQREAGWLRGTEGISATVARVRLAGFRAGEGPTVLLVHGWGDQAARLGGLIGPLVDAGFEVVAVDLPSHGRSDPGPVDLYSLASVIAELADRFDARAVVAHSLGATVTTLALRDGMDVDGVALVAPPVRLEVAVDRFAEVYRIPRRAIAGLRSRIEDRFGPGVWADVALDRVARDLEVPALIIHDRRDPQVPVEGSRRLAAAWPGARLHRTDGLGHHRILRDQHVADTIVAYVEDAITPVDRALPEDTVLGA